MRWGPAAIAHRSSIVSRYLALAVVVAAPLPFGSIDQPWPAVWSGLMGLSLLLAHPVHLPRHVRHALLVLGGLAAAWIVVLLLQGSRDPGLGLAFDWPEGERLVTADQALRVSASAQNPFLTAGPALLMALTFARFVLLGAETGGAEQTLRTIRVSAVAIGLISFVLFIGDPERLLGRTKVYYLGNFTGTFVNRNTAAAFFGTACLLWASRLRDIVPEVGRPPPTLVGIVIQVTDRLNGAVMMSALAAIFCFGLAATTGSRAGFLLTAAILLPVLTWSGSRRRGSRAILRAVAIALALALVAVTVGGLIGTRLSTSGLADRYRLEVYRICLTLVGQHPWLGIGLGNFETVFPTIRTPTMGMRGVWEFAHSTPLELMVEVGWPLALATALAWVAVAVRMLRPGSSSGSMRIRRPALAVFVFGATHSLIDFPLQVPGYAIVFAAIAGCGFARSAHRSKELPFGNTRSST